MSSTKALSKFGEPGKREGLYMSVWEVPDYIQKAFSHVKFSALGTIGFPKKIYINNLFLPDLLQGLNNVIDRGLCKEMKTWDGCYIIRTKRLSKSYSMHSWGLAFDVNASENMQGKEPKLSKEFAQCFKDAGMKWGGDWTGRSIDAMHFEKIL